MARISKDEAREAARRQKTYSPKINPLDYKASLIWYLNYHNTNTDPKIIRGWALDYIKKNHPKKLSVLEVANDFDLKTIGVLANAVSRGEPLQQEELDRLEKEVHDVFEKCSAAVKPTKRQEKKDQQPVVKVDRTAEIASEVAAEIDGAIDEFCTENKETSAKGILHAKNVNAQVAKLVAEKYVRLEKELQEVLGGKDAQLKEAYAHFGKVKLKRFLAYVQQIIADCMQQAVTVKAQRKPRTKKEKPASVLVAKMKYMKTFTELGLKSDSTEKIVGASEVWLYDTQYRNIIVVEADQGTKLSVKGTTITGYSVANTSKKKLRKPEEFFKDLSLTKVNLHRAYKAVKAKPQAFTGRVNENMIILKVI